ncbi:MAG: tail fiber domain-containing protein, partial [Candidatus Taylorbacteria bacterium]|nr:tail fiber domain-containing protein [Candidatus Taylorbacteria bacterium]
TWSGLNRFTTISTTTFSGGIEAGTLIGAPYFHATSSTATSTLAGGLMVGSNSGLVVEGGATASSLYVSTSGNVGIGTASPDYKLEVNGQLGVNSDLVLMASEVAQGYVFGSGSNLFLRALNNQDIIFQDSGATNVTFKGDGNVGIGTVSPSTKLEVFGPLRVTGTTAAGYQFTKSADDTSLQLSYYTDATTKYKDLVNFNYDGKVGIGTTSPSSMLTITGATPAITAHQTLTLYSSDAMAADKGGTIGFGGNYTAGGDLAGWASIAGLKENGTTGNLAGYLQFGTRSDAGSNSEVMRITSAGNVGVGTTSPYSMLSIGNSRTTAANTPLFTLASTTDGTATTTAFTVLANGNVGIGTAAPGYKLDLTEMGANVAIGFTSGSGAIFTMYKNNASDYFAIRHAGAADRFVINNTGIVGIGQSTPNQGQMEVKGGSVCVDTNSDNNASSCIASESDARLKQNIVTLSGPESLNTIMKLNPVSFDWRVNDPEVLSHYPLISRFASSTRSLGLIAQEVGSLVPEAIMLETVGDAAVQYLQLDYDKFVPILVSAIQELDARDSLLSDEVSAAAAAIAGFERGISIVATPTTTPSIYIGADGNVGIGTSPAAKLSVEQGSATTVGMYLAGYANATADMFRISTSTLTATSTAFIIDSNGKMGIGTTSPSQQLSVSGNGLFSGTLSIGSLADATSCVQVGTDGMLTRTGSACGAGGGIPDSKWATSTNPLSIYPAGAQNVGIGTTSPWAMLSVSGTSTQSSIVPLFAVATSTSAASSTAFLIKSSGSIGLGTTTPVSMLTIDGMGRLASTSTQTVGIDQVYHMNLSGAGTQFGNSMYVYNNPQVNANTMVASIMRVQDNTALANTVRGLEVQTHRGTNTAGENTAINAFGMTFGVKGITQGTAGAVYTPAGLYGETRGTTQGNALRVYSTSITTADLAYFFHDADSTAFDGSALRMDMSAGDVTGAGFTGNFLDLRSGGAVKFLIESSGTTTIGDGFKAAGLQIGYGGLCVDNDGSCTASTTGRITSMESQTAHADLAEVYFTDEALVPGDIVYAKGGYNVSKAGKVNEGSILGVVSTKPGLLIGFDDRATASTSVPIALAGRVPVIVSTENGAIKPGDKIKLSSISGVGMKQDSDGNIIGIALESFDGTQAVSEGTVDAERIKRDRPQLAQDTIVREDPCEMGGGAEIGVFSCTKRGRKVTKVTKTQTDNVDHIGTVTESSIGAPAKDATTPGGKTVKVGKIQVFVNLGYAKVDPALTNISSEAASTTALWNIDRATGKVTLDGSATSVDLSDRALTNVKRIESALGTWSISDDGVLIIKDIIAQTGRFQNALQVGTPEKRTGITLFDEVSGEPYCLSIAAGVAKSTAGACGAATTIIDTSSNTSTTTSNTSTTTDPDLILPPADTETPMLDLNGENPATINKGTSYSDLGARIVNEQDNNLGIKAIVDGLDVGDQSQITLDTAAAGSHTIEYYAVDQGGNRGSILRTVNVVDPFANTASSTPVFGGEGAATDSAVSSSASSTGPLISTPVSTSTASSTP